MPKILLIAGHGGGQPGATGNGAVEHEEVKQVVLKMAPILKAAGVDLETITDNYTLPQKIIHANKGTYDFVLEVHMDSGPATSHGAMMYYYGGSSWSKTQAIQMLKTYCDTSGIENDGVKPDTASRFKQLGIIREVKPFSLLLETGYISNKADLEEVRKDAAFSAATMLLNYYKIPMDKIFTDVDKNHPYYEFAKWAKDNGIMQGYPDGRLGIDEPLTVGRLLAILFKFAKFLKK